MCERPRSRAGNIRSAAFYRRMRPNYFLTSAPYTYCVRTQYVYAGMSRHRPRRARAERRSRPRQPVGPRTSYPAGSMPERRGYRPGRETAPKVIIIPPQRQRQRAPARGGRAGPGHGRGEPGKSSERRRRLPLLVLAPVEADRGCGSRAQRVGPDPVSDEGADEVHLLLEQRLGQAAGHVRRAAGPAGRVAQNVGAAFLG